MAARISPDMAAAREGMVLYRKVGCPRCNRTGYKGRVGVFQLLIMNDEIESLAAQNAHRDEIERSAAAGGMRSLWDDGIAKAAAGLISLEELLASSRRSRMRDGGAYPTILEAQKPCLLLRCAWILKPGTYRFTEVARSPAGPLRGRG